MAALNVPATGPGPVEALSVTGLSKSFAVDGRCLPVIQDLDLRLGPAERLALIGPSGCGKSTLLNIIAGLETASAGELRLAPSARLAYMFQEPRLVPWRSVTDNLRLVLPHSNEQEARIEQWLSAVGLAEHRHQYASKLSLGMARRAALARAFIIEPDILLMDEPFASLDLSIAFRLQSLLLDLLHRAKTAMLFVTHDLREAIRLCDRVLLLTQSPARLEVAFDVELSDDERRDEQAVEAFRAQVVETHHIDTGQLQRLRGADDG